MRRMHGALKAEERCVLQPQTLEKPRTLSELSCPGSERGGGGGGGEGGGGGGGDGEEGRRRPSVHYESLPLDGSEDEKTMTKPLSNAVTMTSHKPPLNTVSCNNRNVLLKSFSLPNPEKNPASDLPDPFPELSRQRLSTVPAGGIHGPAESSASLPNSPEKTVDHLSAAASCAPAATSSCAAFTDRTAGGDINKSSAESKMTVPVFVNAQTFYPIDIGDCTSVSDVCDHLAQLTHSKRDPFWTIVEQVDKFNLERSLDDHELLIPILKSWNSAANRLVYRRDCCRYELYSNPNHCFPERMLDVKLPNEGGSKSFMTRNELYRNLLLKCLLANESMPDIQGFLHIRDGKKSWKRHFCVLRHSGLYYVTKGCVKDSRHMVLLSDLKSDSVYAVLNSRKAFGVPKQHGFCLAPSHDLSDKHKLLQFCADDEQSRHCWITGMRFVKFGDQLLENCRRFASYNSSWKVNTAASERIKGCISKICDEVVINPVIKVPNQDFRGDFQSSGQTCLRSRLTKSFSSVFDSSSAEALTSAHDAARRSSGDSPHPPLPPLPPPSPRNNLEWFHALIGRNEAISLLSNDGLKEGSFLVRHSQTLYGVYVLSFVHSGTVKHCTIHKTKLDDGWCYSLDGGSTKFADLAQLIDFYRLNAGRLPTRLAGCVTCSSSH